jgi:N-acetylneuraminic acid mutarotase
LKSAIFKNIRVWSGVIILAVGAIVISGCGKIWQNVNYKPFYISATWVSGSNIGNQRGIYGVKGTGSTANIPGGRTGANSWSDASGNLWLFGGAGQDSTNTYGYLNDLWEYSPSTKQWTWISGSNVVNQNGAYGALGAGSTLFTPGARWSSKTFTDASGNLWLFGGYGYDSAGNLGDINDLWRFTPSTLQWAWISGSNTWFQGPTYGTRGVGSTSNIPGARADGASWTDSAGNFWLFGGNGLDGTGAGVLGDLWEYTPSSNKWTWVSGNNVRNMSGIYGTQNVGSTANVPGTRESLVWWLDHSGNFWLLGGIGYDGSGANGSLNDLWEYTPSNNQWTWVSGSNLVNQLGKYGVGGIATASSVPSARTNIIASWTDSSGNFWMFGGIGYDSVGINGYLNDVWEYVPSTHVWTWVAGSNLVNRNPNYGTLGIPAYNNIPGARNTPISWTDSSGNFWLFGGFGYDATGNQTSLNDLWLFGLP